MKSATASTLKTQLVRFLNQSEPVMVMHQGRTKAILFPVDEKTAATFEKPKPPTLMALLREADERISRTGGLSHEEFWRAVDAKFGHEPLKKVHRRKRKSQKSSPRSPAR